MRRSNLTIGFMAIVSTVLLVSSCAYQVEPIEKDKRVLYTYKIKNLVVAPFLDHTNSSGLSKKVTDIFTAELARFAEAAVPHSTSVEAYLKENNIILDEQTVREQAIAMGKIFNVDAVLIGAVTEVDYYFPPKLGLSFELISVLDGTSIFAWSETYDATFNYIREDAKQYAGFKKTGDSVYGNEIVLRKMDMFIEFVCHELIRKNL